MSSFPNRGRERIGMQSKMTNLVVFREVGKYKKSSHPHANRFDFFYTPAPHHYGLTSPNGPLGQPNLCHTVNSVNSQQSGNVVYQRMKNGKIN